jgi:hypothetical protein
MIHELELGDWVDAALNEWTEQRSLEGIERIAMGMPLQEVAPQDTDKLRSIGICANKPLCCGILLSRPNLSIPMPKHSVIELIQCAMSHFK